MVTLFGSHMRTPAAACQHGPRKVSQDHSATRHLSGNGKAWLARARGDVEVDTIVSQGQQPDHLLPDRSLHLAHLCVPLDPARREAVPVLALVLLDLMCL
jgi:hypothetical protein